MPFSTTERDGVPSMDTTKTNATGRMLFFLGIETVLRHPRALGFFGFYPVFIIFGHISISSGAWKVPTNCTSGKGWVCVLKADATSIAALVIKRRVEAQLLYIDIPFRFKKGQCFGGGHFAMLPPPARILWGRCR